ncbi:MAG: transporter substrate-binding domain-containing protein [Desulfarculaceae bacterium]|nr:transporter substrate-binding domain-containing protein [Desulfarculaceae bacterium]
MILIGCVVESSAAQHSPVQSAAEINYPPFSLVDEDGKANGFAVELMQAALGKMGREVTFRTGPWKEVKGWLEKGEIQALPLVGRTPEREPLFDFTFPYMSLHGAIVVREGTTGLRDLEDLKGRQVAVMKGDNAEEFLLREDRGIDVQSVATFKKALEDLSKGMYDAVFIQRLVAIRLIREHSIEGLRVMEKPVEEFQQDWCFAVKEGDRETLALLNEGLSLVMADGTFRHLHAKWFAALELPKDRRIIIGGDRNYPPFEYLDEKGRPTGFNVAVTRAIARELDLDIKIRLGPWSRIRQALADGEIDAIQGMLYSAERDLTFDFTQAYTVNHYVAATRKEEGPAPASAEELQGKRIVVQKGDIMHDFALKNGLGKYTTAVASQEDALRELAEGRYDCALIARLTALYWIDRHGWDNLSVARDPLLSPGYGYAVPNNRKALLAQLSEGLKIIEQTGEYRRIYEKWLGVYKDRDFGALEFLKYAAMIILPLLLLAAGFLLWSWSLRRQVRERTEELRKSENLLQRVFEILPIGLWFADRNGNLFRGNPAGIRIWEGKPHAGSKEYGVFKARRLPSREEVQPDDRALLHTLRDGATITDELLEIDTPDGSTKTILNYTAPVLDSKGEIEAAVIANLDVTDLIKTEQALVASEIRHRTLIDTIVDLIWLKDENGAYLSCNPTFESFFGAKESEIKGKTDYDFVDKELADFFRRHDKKAMEAGRPSINEESLTFAEDGYQGVFETIKTPVHDTGGSLIGILGVARDITGRKNAEQEKIELERKLSQTRKMETIGTLAGGIAHDFNNILTSIMGYTQLCMSEVEENTAMHEDLSQILKAGNRASDLVRQILAVSRKDEQEIVPIQLTPLIKEALKMMRSTLPSSITLKESIPEISPVVKADATKLHQVIVNLATNAMHAMTDSTGTLEIMVDTVTFDEHIRTRYPDMTPGKFVRISVSDTGCGIRKDHLDRIFEPYFTTREKEEGTGLGLSVVHGIVKSHGGHITVYSEPERGTAFHVYLPETRESSGEKTEKKQGPLPKGVEHILLIDDEEQIVDIHRRLLENQGYTVTVQTKSLNALELFRTSPEKFDIVVTDMTMPEMTGDKIAREIKQIRPAIPVLLCTGYNERINGQEQNPDFDEFLMKPIDKATFVITVRRLLDSP